MSTYPTAPRIEFVEWCDVHAPIFIEQAAVIGVTPDQADAFADETVAARAALLEQYQARQAALSASLKAREAMRQLRERAGSTVRTIRAFAETQKSPTAVYKAAQIPAPSPGTPAPPPSQPRNLSAILNATTGALTLRWKARQPAGVGPANYLVRRRLPGETAFAFIGVAGKKTFVDDTLPAGVPQVEYTAQAQRGARSGPVSAILLVNIGSIAGQEGTKALRREGTKRMASAALMERAAP